MKQISFLIPSFNTLPYLKFCIETIKKNLNGNHEICIVDDGSEDGSQAYLTTLSNDPQIKYKCHEENLGIPETYNDLVNIASHSIINLIHTDIIIPKDYDIDILPYLEEYDFVTPFRCEPPMYPSSNDKIQHDFGKTWDTFDEQEFESFYAFHKTLNKGVTQLRTCFPWITTKKVFSSVGGIDTLFRKYMVDDDDFYLRVIKHGYSYIQPLDCLVYHFCSKSTKFKEKQQKTDTKQWEDQATRSANNFVRKWHRPAGEVYNRDNSINNFGRYNILTVMSNPTMTNDIKMCEMMSDYVIYDTDTTTEELIQQYINNEQPYTDYNLRAKFVQKEHIPANFKEHIILELNFSQIVRTLAGNDMISISRFVDYNMQHVGKEIKLQSGINVFITHRTKNIHDIITNIPPCI